MKSAECRDRWHPCRVSQGRSGVLYGPVAPAVLPHWHLINPTLPEAVAAGWYGAIRGSSSRRGVAIFQWSSLLWLNSPQNFTYILFICYCLIPIKSQLRFTIPLCKISGESAFTKQNLGAFVISKGEVQCFHPHRKFRLLKSYWTIGLVASGSGWSISSCGCRVQCGSGSLSDTGVFFCGPPSRPTEAESVLQIPEDPPGFQTSRCLCLLLTLPMRLCPCMWLLGLACIDLSIVAVAALLASFLKQVHHIGGLQEFCHNWDNCCNTVKEKQTKSNKKFPPITFVTLLVFWQLALKRIAVETHPLWCCKKVPHWYHSLGSSTWQTCRVQQSTSVSVKLKIQLQTEG